MFLNNLINRPFVLLTCIISVVLLAAPLFQQGEFIDGLLYKTVANNYFTGEGSFWNMKFSNTSMNPFFEQPPLFFFATGVFYKVFGNSFPADKCLTVFFFLVSIYLIIKICKQLFKENEAGVMVVFLLFTIPVFCWAHVHQVIESLVLPLTLAGFYCFFKFQKNNQAVWQQIILPLCFAVVCVLLFLTKGFQSCFVIAAPFLYFLFFRDKKALVFALVSVVLISLMLYIFIFVYQPSANWFTNYAHKRLLGSLNNVGATTTYRAEIIVRIVSELIVTILFVAIGFVYFRATKKANAVKTGEEKKMAWFVLILALLGSVPYVITLEQRGFYLVPSFPFYIIAITLFFREQLLSLYHIFISFLIRKVVKTIVFVLFLCSLGYWVISPTLYKRDEDLLKDLAVIKTHLTPGDTVSVDEVMWNDTPLHAYLYMQNKVSVEGNYHHTFYIHDKEHSVLPDTGYIKIELPVKKYELYRRKISMR